MFSKERRLETRHLNMIKSSPFFELRYLAVKCKKCKSPFQNWEWTLFDREFFSDSNDPMLAWQDPSVMSNKFGKGVIELLLRTDIDCLHGESKQLSIWLNQLQMMFQ